MGTAGGFSDSNTLTSRGYTSFLDIQGRSTVMVGVHDE